MVPVLINVEKGHTDPFHDMCDRVSINCPTYNLNAYRLFKEYKSGNCFVMSLLSLATPAWIKVNCNQPLVQHIFCQISENKLINAASLKTIPKMKSCLKGHILLNNNCYIFIWYKFGTKIQKSCQPQNFSNFHIEQFQVLFDATADTFPPIFSPDLKYIITYKRYWNIYSYKLKPANIDEEGMYVCKIQKSQQFVGGHIFKCSYGIFISYIFVCDGKNDCPGETSIDEEGCECKTTFYYTSKCKLIYTQFQTECSDFYFKTWDGTCKMYDFTLVSGENLMPWLKHIANNKRPDNQQPIDENKEKPILTIGPKKGKLSCQSIKFLSRVFYEISEICSYKLNEQGYLHPCKKGEHLQNCKFFECEVMFKCPDFYCIPWGYLCDGKWDCPSGYDESIYNHCQNRTCINMFKCRMSAICLHLGDVCNGKFDCPYKDDESLCLLNDTSCALGCQCLAFAIRCISRDISKYSLPNNFSYIAVTILNSTLGLFIEDRFKIGFQNVLILSVSSSNFKNICPIVSFLKHVLTVDFSKNDISQIRSNCFRNKFSLKVIKLNDNVLRHVDKFAFHNSSTLFYIDLSNNKLTFFYKNSFIGSDKLLFLSLENNKLNKIRSKNIFNDLNIKFLRTEYFSMCCFAVKNVKCSAKKPWYVSCSPLLLNNLTKCIFYFISFAIIVTNILHLIIQRKYKVEKQNFDRAGPFASIIISITILDMIGSIHVFILWLSDLYFKDNIVLVQNQWKSNIICFICSGTSIFYGFASPLLYNLLSYTRYEVVKNPINSNFKRSDFIAKITLVGYIISLFFACWMIIMFWWKKGTMPTIFCSPFFDPSGTFSLAENLAWFTIIFHFIAFWCNLIIHFKLLAEVMIYKNDTFSSKSRKQSKRSLFIQILCISCSHLLCWILDMVVLLISNLQRIYPMEIILYKLVLITPLNSILIPLIFITKEMKKNLAHVSLKS